MSTPPLNPALFSLDPDHLWLMHCSEGPIPRSALRACRAFLYKELQPWDLKWKEDFLGGGDRCKAQAAKVIGAAPEDLSLTATTSSGLQAVSLGFPWRPGDEALAPLGEFPSNAWPWLALRDRRVGFREVPLWEGHRAGADALASTPPPADADPEARLLAAIGSATAILTVSWVRFQDGLRLDLPRLAAGCRARGVALVVDGIQGCGTHVPDLTGVAAFATGGHKGLLSPQGLGFLWTDPTFRGRLIPSGTWLSVEQGTDFSRPSTDFDRPFLEDGRRLEAGSPPLLMAATLEASLAELNHAGIPRITAHVERLQRGLLRKLETGPWGEEALRLRGLLEADRLGPFLAFHHGGRDLAALLQRGLRQGIYASVREGYLRIAFHGWHGEADLARIAAWMDTVS
ncbi:MAG TPA: aminotransferase class V-fold PLP-dependent enzyme [Holophagaceae bacterium]|nr:aminotransferase class V-fold PLP-dependent enzyme [Holophagaceae bacterium]HJW32242.1 aminotransferase class V-fold PLP-dependent enzyme [Holophagaceae bacterium]